MNPYETDNVADVLNRALEMGIDERRLRMNQLKRREKRMDVDAWVRGFMSGMNSIQTSNPEPNGGNDGCRKFSLTHFGDHSSHPATLGNSLELKLGPYVQMSSKLGVILDFDGTLSGLAKTPELAFICPESKKSLERLSNMADVHVAIISGRNLEDLREKVCTEVSKKWKNRLRDPAL